MLDDLAVFTDEFDGQLALSGKFEVRRAVLIAEGMAADDDRLRPARHKPRHVLADDRLAENDTAEDIADRTVGRLPHLLQGKLFDALLVRRDCRAFDADAVFLDRVGRIDGNLVVRLVSMFDTEIEIFEVDVEIGVDQLFLDELPDNAGHLVAVEFDDRVCHLDLRHEYRLVSRAGECAGSGVATGYSKAALGAQTSVRLAWKNLAPASRATRGMNAAWPMPAEHTESYFLSALSDLAFLTLGGIGPTSAVASAIQLA